MLKRMIPYLVLLGRSKGELGQNLQILYGQCHIYKTSKDLERLGLKILQEPDEVKISCPALKTRGG